MKTPKVNKDQVKKLSYQLRNSIGNTLVAVLAVLYVAEHVQSLSFHIAYAIAAGIVGLVLFFANHK